MSMQKAVLTIPSALRLVEPMALRLVSGLVLGPLVASFLGGSLAWLSVPVGVLVAIGLLSRGGTFGPRVVVDARGVWHGRALLLPRAAVDFAYVAPRKRTAIVRFLSGSDVTAELEVCDAEEGLRVLEAMRLGAGARVARVGPTLPMKLAFALGVLVVTLGAAGLLFGLATGLPWLVLIAVVGLFFAPGLLSDHEVRVGADGINIRTGLSARYVPFSDVLGLDDSDNGVIVHLARGERIVLRTPARLWGATREEVRTALVETLTTELARYRACSPPSSASRIEAVGPGSERHIAFAEGTFRIAALPVEQLVEIASCPSATERARELAGRALASVEEEWAQEELARAADACASPALKPVLTRPRGR
ncbi:MAG: hypothetical protein HOV80_23155 [Polyangiaceae bacterium]|nr:hypothetical protein [Polyangiaceae bacterium]